jgi:hypothetical protein
MSPHRQSDAGLVRQIGSTSVPRLLAVDTGSQRGVELRRCQRDVIYAHNHHCARKSIEDVVRRCEHGLCCQRKVGDRRDGQVAIKRVQTSPRRYRRQVVNGAFVCNVMSTSQRQPPSYDNMFRNCRPVVRAWVRS